MKTYTWVETIYNAPSSVRKKIKNATLDGISYFKAKYVIAKTNPLEKTKSGSVKVKQGEPLPPEYKLKSKNKQVENFVKDLEKENGVDFVGFIPKIEYIKDKGTKMQLEALWQHGFGSPALLYAHKELPMLIIAGPNLMFNDSIVNNIKENLYNDKVCGITG
jgi:hypothetical protein